MRLVESEMSPKWRKNLASWMSGFACRWSIRLVLKVEARRMIPWTSYPFSSRSSARYDPSCPVMPVTSAFFIRILRGKKRPLLYLVAWFTVRSYTPPRGRTPPSAFLKYLLKIDRLCFDRQPDRSQLSTSKGGPMIKLSEVKVRAQYRTRVRY